MCIAVMPPRCLRDVPREPAQKRGGGGRRRTKIIIRNECVPVIALRAKNEKLLPDAKGESEGAALWVEVTSAQSNDRGF